MREYLCIGFIEFMLNGKSLTDFTNLFSPNNFKKNYTVILEYFFEINMSMSMSESHVCDTKFDNTLRFRLSSIKDIEDIFIAEIHDRKDGKGTQQVYHST